MASTLAISYHELQKYKALFLHGCESLHEAVSMLLCIQNQKWLGLKLPLFFSVSLSCLETYQNAGGNLKVCLLVLPTGPRNIHFCSVWVKTVVSKWMYEQILFDMNLCLCEKQSRTQNMQSHHSPGRETVQVCLCQVTALFDNIHMIIQIKIIWKNETSFCFLKQKVIRCVFILAYAIKWMCIASPRTQGLFHVQEKTLKEWNGKKRKKHS